MCLLLPTRSCPDQLLEVDWRGELLGAVVERRRDDLRAALRGMAVVPEEVVPAVAAQRRVRLAADALRPEPPAAAARAVHVGKPCRRRVGYDRPHQAVQVAEGVGQAVQAVVIARAGARQERSERVGAVVARARRGKDENGRTRSKNSSTVFYFYI